MHQASRIYVAGGETLLGAALIEALRGAGYENLVGTPPDEPDLTNAGQVEDFFSEARPEYVFVAAGMSGGIKRNQTCPADLMLHNLLVTAHVVDAAYRHKVTKLLYIASSCSYPREAPQPLRVESLQTGPLEQTSAAYATAKLAGIQLCQAYRQQHGVDFITAIPANPFGPHDDFSEDNAHVIPALMRKFHEAKTRKVPEVTVWGTGKPRREFIYIRDLAEACLFVMANYDGTAPINLGGGWDMSIAEIARAIADIVGYEGRLQFDATQPDGAPLKSLDSAVLHDLGWRPQTPFQTALMETYAWFRENIARTALHPKHFAKEATMHQRLYRALFRIRRLEEEVARVYPSDKIKSPVHLSIGQEAVSVGVCEALQPQDVVFGTYRGHALYLAKGGDMREMVAELYGKATGCAKGKGGSMHLVAADVGMMGTSAVVGTTIPNAAGYAYSLQLRNRNAIVVSFFGDGATEEGVFAETLNFAVLKRLPLIFVCENNQYAIHTHQSRRQGTPAICDRVRAHGLPAERIEDNDVLRLHERIQAVAAEVRAGAGPWFFEVMTYRWREHVGPNNDYALGYRTTDEADSWVRNDPLPRLAGMLDAAERSQIEQEVEAEIEAAFAFAEESPWPEDAELYTDVFMECS